jgi:nucleoside triphosphate pyrophosphatase
MLPDAAPQFVLASASPRRRELLGALGLVFAVAPADLDEVAIGTGMEPDRAAVAVASAKAAAIAPREATVLAADTMVVLDGRVLGKPASADEAARMLEALRGRSHEVITAMALRVGAVVRAALRRSTVRMRAYARAEIDGYVATGAGLDKAGAYGIQDDRFQPVEAIEGCWCNVMGLPLWTAVRALDEAGCRAPRRPDQAFARCAACPLASEDVA